MDPRRAVLNQQLIQWARDMDAQKEAMIAHDDGRSASANKPAMATPAADIERQIMDSTIQKNEREWWAAREIERLRSAEREMKRGYLRELAAANALRAEIEFLKSELGPEYGSSQAKPTE